MFHASDSDEDEAGDRLRRLAKKRRMDMQDDFDQERHEFTGQRRLSESSTESSDEEKSDSERKDSVDESSEDNESAEPSNKKAKEDVAASSNSAGNSKGGGQSIAERLMAKQGYVPGTGLGKAAAGRVEPIELSTQRGRVGLGHTATKVVGRDFSEVWDENMEDKTVEEHIKWMHPCDDDNRENAANQCQNGHWMKVEKEKMTLDDEDEFCQRNFITEMISAKDVFDHLSDRELREARTRANPYETIGGAFFQNRAAMKTANMDRCFDWIFSQEFDRKARERKNPIDLNADASNEEDRDKDLFYFADVCAGPGGFSEYMLWRKGFYNTKGFGFTLRGKDDFKLGKFTASSAHFFEPYYGVAGDGDVMNPENIDALEEFISKGTNGLGVHLMMADGGFSVEGKENIQEILSKRLYLCQLLVSLCIVRQGGNFFCKLFDIFTPFSVGLIYLMYVCYDEVSLHKPHTSRPANSERYIICKGLRKEYSDRVRDYLKKINREMDKLKKKGSSDDVMQCVPMDVMKDDQEFTNYVVEHNERLAVRQTTYLRKYLSFARNQGQIDKDQGRLRDECLKYWMVPNRQRKRDNERVRVGLNPEEMLGRYCSKIYGNDDFNCNPPEFTLDILSNPGDKHLKHAEFMCTRVCGKQKPHLLVSSGDAVFIFDGRWNRMNNEDVRIPDKTILLVEEVEVYTNPRTERVSTTGERVLRVLDAAVLHGDNIAKLSYEHRLEAARKFCKALKLVVPEVKIGWGNRERKIKPTKLTIADVYHPEDLAETRQDFSKCIYKGEELLLFQENDFTFVCRAIRFVRILNPDWKMGWSRSRAERFAFCPKGGSIPEPEFRKKELWTSFWDTAVLKKSRSRDTSQPIMQCIWKWAASLETDYGPSVIMNEESHRSGPTLLSLNEIIKETERQVKQ